MKTTIAVLLNILMLTIVVAQETDVAVASTAAQTLWKHTVIMSANLTQVSFTDWAQGGENALAYALFLEGKSTYSAEPIEWVNSYKFGFGQAKLGSQGIRKTDDKIDLESVLTYKLGVYINPYASASLKTQFVEGVVFASDGTSVPVSDFFDPAYITQSLGVGYQPIAKVKTRLGVGVREIVTSRYRNYSEGKKILVDGGVESVTEVGWTLMENIVVTSKLELFAPLNNFKKTLIRSDNTLAAKVNKYVSANLNVYLLNDPKTQARTQIKQTLALGISYTLL